jgi:hypothetical protein
MDDSRDDRIGNALPTMPTEAALRAMMDQSDRDVAPGRTVSLVQVLAYFDGVISQM